MFGLNKKQMYRYIDYGHIAAEIQLIIGLVTAGLYLFYEFDIVTALGIVITAVTLRYFVIVGLMIAENNVYMKEQIGEIALAMRQDTKPGKVKRRKRHDSYYWLRVALISVTVFLGIVFSVWFFNI